MASTEKDAPPASLDRLPTEILTEICMQLCEHCHPEKLERDKDDPFLIAPSRPTALQALSHTSQHLRSIALPILYHDTGTLIHSYSWLYEVAFERDLAKSVKVLRLGEVDGDEMDHIDFFMTLAKEHHMDVENSCEIQGALKKEPQYSHIFAQLYDEVVLAMCPNVETVFLPVFDDPGTKQSTFWHFEKRLERLGDSAQLKKLRHLTLSNNEYEYDGFRIFTPAIGVILSAASALETLVLGRTSWLDEDYEGEFDPIIFAPALQNLTTLELINSKIAYRWIGHEMDWDGPGYRALCEVIGMAKSLKHFRYISKMKEDDKEHIPPGYLVKALRPRCETLETIEISTDDIMSYGDYPPIYLDMMVDKAALEPFRNLQTLRLDEASFCHHLGADDLSECVTWNCIMDMLPPTVKHFTVGMNCDLFISICDIIEVGTAVQNGEFPALETVRVLLQYGPDNEEVRPLICKSTSDKLYRMLSNDGFWDTDVEISMDPDPTHHWEGDDKDGCR